MKPMAVNLITGALGAGKTTLLRHLLAHKPANEHWLVLVNEFGLVGIDGAILSQHSAQQVTIEEIPGGCICCSALGELTQTLQRIANTTTTPKPHRILIEPTGLGEPDSLVDLLKSPQLARHFDVQTVFAVFDSAHIQPNDFEHYTIMKNLANMADVIVFNKQDDTQQPSALEALHHYALQLYPPKADIIFTQYGQIEPGLIQLSSVHSNPNQRTHWPIHGHLAPLTRPGENLFDPVPYPTQALPNLIARRYRQDNQLMTIGWIFNDQACFEWPKLQALFASLNAPSPTVQDLNTLPGLAKDAFNNVQRAKGVFKVGKPSMLFQWVNQHTQRELIAYRRDSRLELLIDCAPEQTWQTEQTGLESNKIGFDFEAFEHALGLCQRQQTGV